MRENLPEDGRRIRHGVDVDEGANREGDLTWAQLLGEISAALSRSDCSAAV